MKKFYMSKTILANLVALIVLMVELHSGFIISPEEQAALLAVMNLVLRWVTHESIGP